MTHSNALIIFAREPKPGKVKTRLLTDLDTGFVTGLYRAFIQDVMTLALRPGDWSPFLYFADDDADPPFLSEFRARCPVVPQQGEDLGARMYRAAGDCFALGYRRVSIIGTDCLEVTGVDIKQAFADLERTEYCVGPSADGGYYLIGMNVLRPEPFADIDWGTPTVLSKTLEKVRQIEHNVSLLSEKEDIDTIAALLKLRGRVLAGGVDAAYTAQFIREHQQSLPDA